MWPASSQRDCAETSGRVDGHYYHKTSLFGLEEYDYGARCSPLARFCLLRHERLGARNSAHERVHMIPRYIEMISGRLTDYVLMVVTF